MSFRVVFCLFHPNRQLYLKNKRERPARKTDIFAEVGFRERSEDLSPVSLGTQSVQGSWWQDTSSENLRARLKGMAGQGVKGPPASS